MPCFYRNFALLHQLHKMGLLYTKPTAEEGDMLTLFGAGGGSTDEAEIRRRTLPAEWHRQSCVQLTWPHEDTDWADMLPEVEACYLRMAYEIALREPLLIVSPRPDKVQRLVQEQLPARVCERIAYFAAPTDDTWARDHAFITVIGGECPELLDFRFNGWGGKFDARRDNDINRRLYESGMLKGTYSSHLDFELEGGSIESDGRGTLLVTSECLLAANRNPRFSKEEIEERLRSWFGAEKVLWLDHGYLEGDDTDSHIDTLARLCPSDTIVYVRCTDKADAHHEALARMEEQLRTFTTASGKPFRLLALPMANPAYHDGERLPATYANFLVINGAVLYPTYSDPENDERAARVLAEAFPKYDIVGIDCRALIRQHGSLHCATMQYPIGVFDNNKE